MLAQTSVDDDAAAIVGVVATVMLVVIVFTPQLLVPVTEYTVVADGATEVLAVLAPLLHTYAVDVPLAVNVAVAPVVHRTPAVGVTVIDNVGTSFTVTLSVLVFAQPDVVPVTE